jgi:hypothetical protein
MCIVSRRDTTLTRGRPRVSAIEIENRFERDTDAEPSEISLSDVWDVVEGALDFAEKLDAEHPNSAVRPNEAGLSSSAGDAVTEVGKAGPARNQGFELITFGPDDAPAGADSWLNRSKSTAEPNRIPSLSLHFDGSNNSGRRIFVTNEARFWKMWEIGPSSSTEMARMLTYIDDSSLRSPIGQHSTLWMSPDEAAKLHYERAIVSANRALPRYVPLRSDPRLIRFGNGGARAGLSGGKRFTRILLRAL